MEDTLLLDAAERFIRGEMSPQEKIYFEELRKNNAELDQAVVEQMFFLNQLDAYASQKQFKHTVSEVEQKLTAEGFITAPVEKKQAKVLSFWSKNKRTIAVAASIAGLVSIFIASVVNTVTPKADSTALTPLVVKLNEQDIKQRRIEDKVDALTAAVPEAIKQKIESKFRATGFMIDADNNYIVTNAHVINEAKNHLIVENNKGDQYAAKAVYVNKVNDMAILKVIDKDFTKLSSPPYAIRRNNANLGEQVFVLGFPKQEIVYTEGYVSAKNGYLMDTSYCQLITIANVGNSGSPVINKNGELIGIISSRETDDAGVVFAIKSVNIFRAADMVRSQADSINIKITGSNKLKGLSREAQIKKMEDYVFMIKGN